MIKRIYNKDIREHVGKEVVVAGFVHALRVQSKIIFLILRDITGIIQTVVSAYAESSGETKEAIEAFETAGALSLESVVKITGVADTRGGQGERQRERGPDSV